MKDELFDQKGLEVFIKRDDLIHPIVAGNKWRKLKEYLLIAQNQEKKGIVTFGGAYSNHIFALGYICKELQIPLDIIIRGEELSIHSNSYLSTLHQWGNHLHFISRKDYREKRIPKEIYYENKLIIPEGGFSEVGVRSMIELVKELNESFDYIVLAVGTGTTLIGIAQALPSVRLCGILSLQNKKEIEKHIKIAGIKADKIKLFEQFIEKKYGKKNTELEEFCIHFNNKFKIPIEPIYTGLMVRSFYELVNKDYFPSGSKILLYHSGGVK